MDKLIIAVIAGGAIAMLTFHPNPEAHPVYVNNSAQPEFCVNEKGQVPCK